MNILVTGCAGYIGQHLLEALMKTEHTVWGIDVKPCPDVEPHFFSLGYFDQEEPAQDIDVIVHLAAWKDVNESHTKPLKYYHNNVARTVNMLKQYKAFVIFASSCSVYGNTPEYVDETSPLKPESPYAQSKVMVEQILKDRGNAVSLRLANVHGNDMKTNQDTSVFVKQHDWDFRRYKGAVRSFVNVRNVVKTIMHFIDNKSLITTLNVVDEVKPLKEVLSEHLDTVKCPKEYPKYSKIRSLHYKPNML